MSTPQKVDGPFPFSQADLEAGGLLAGVRHTLAHFHQWRDLNPGLVADHVQRYTEQLAAIALRAESRRGFRSLLGRFTAPGRKRTETRAKMARDITYFVAYNLAEMPDPAIVDRIVDGFRGWAPSVETIVGEPDPARPVRSVVESLERHLPVLAGRPETAWLGERLDALYRALPEVVVRAGGMGKVVRAAAGVLAIGAYDTRDCEPWVRGEHLARIVPAAYALGAAYVIVDDTLHDLSGDYVPPADKARYHQLIANALATGEPVSPGEVPDHPLAEELHRLHGVLLEHYPFEKYRHLYHAAEAMYLAQYRDSVRTADEVASVGLSTMYEDILVKSGMSRVVANIVGRRELDAGFYARCLNTVVLGQFKDDLRDREEDARAGRLTPFTFPPDRADVNPLYDLFAYDAYVAREVFGGDPAVTDALTYFGAVKLATHLSADHRHAAELTRRYQATSEIDRCLRVASGLPNRTIRRLEPVETRIKDHCGQVLGRRDQTMVDARTFVADRLPHINDITRRCCRRENPTGLDKIIQYAMDAPGKRLRPAIGLMLAAGLGVDISDIEPFVAASELFHTASLLLDDLPAQHDAAVRRGRPTAHTVFDEGSVQLAAVSMISSGFGLLAQLSRQFPADRVTEVIGYVGTVLGPQRLCQGQNLDLHLGRGASVVSGEEILNMYELKTSTTIEAALVPLMMLTDRPAAEVDLVARYARHAGIVFQIRDDILDLTSSTESLGKDVGNDVGKINIVRVYGLAEAERLMRHHLDSAVSCCSRLPFDTRLLEGMVTHFASRHR